MVEAATKTNLVISLHPTDVLRNRGVRSIVRRSRNRGAAADRKAKSAGDRQAYHFATQWSVVGSEIREGRVLVVYLYDVGAAGRKAQRVDDIGTDQVGVPK